MHLNFLIHIDFENEEPYSYLYAFFLLYSLFFNHKTRDLPIHITFLNLINQTPTDFFKKEILKFSKKNFKVQFLKENLYTNYIDKYFLRNASIQYYNKIFNFEKNKFYIYLDSDVINLMPLDTKFINFIKNYINTKSLLIETVPDYIYKLERENNVYLDNNFKLFYNWIQIIDNTNKFIYDSVNYTKELTILKNSDIYISKKISKANLNLIENPLGTYIPKSNKKNYFLHYDNFIDSGTFYKVKDYNPQLFKYLITLLKIKKINFVLKNKKHFFDKYLKVNECRN